MKKVYLITTESAHFADPEDHFVVVAESENGALSMVDYEIDAYYREMYYDKYQYEDEAEDSTYTVVSTEEFTKSNEHYEYFSEPDQQEFYPCYGEDYETILTMIK